MAAGRIGRSRRSILLALALVVLTVEIVAVGIAILLTAQKPVPVVVAITPGRTGQVERCLTCHNGIEPVSASHPTSEFGCVSCHDGNGDIALDKDAAHAGMVVNPGSLDTAQQYCGECHAAQVATVPRSLMSTYAGAISMIRRGFGLQPDGQAQQTIHGFGGLHPFSPAENDPQPVQDFAANCQTCHVSALPEQIDTRYRSTGCSTCHVLYDADGLYTGGDPTIPKDEPGHGATHTFTTAIPYTQCNHCHNQGTYSLRTMTFTPRPDMPSPDSLTGDAKRYHDYYQPGTEFTQCEWELDCIDCHTQQEVMGDGMIHNNKAEAQYVQCATCHGTLDSLPPTHTITLEDDIARIRAGLNPNLSLAVGDTIMVTERGEPLYHIRQVDGGWQLTGKVTGITYDLPLVQGSACLQKPDEQSSASCHQCHLATEPSPPAPTR